MLRTCFLFVFSAFLATKLPAQSNTGNIFGRVWATDSSDGAHSGNSLTIINGVTVQAIAGKDTLYTTTTYNGFQIKKITAGAVTLRFSHLSYKGVIKEVEVKPGQTTEVEIRMEVATQQIEAVTVNGEIPVMVQRGDTLIYNAAAVRTFEGDETMKVVEQLPGVVTSESGVSVMGENITRTYIDGKLIFGSNPMAALQNLLANDVLKIRVYDEHADRNPKYKRRKGDKMERVFNIETKSKLIQAKTGHLLASYGADLNQGGRGNLDRYGIGATANLFSENLLLSANAFLNNINRKSNRINDVIAAKSPKSSYDRTTYVNIGMEKNWYSKHDESTLIRLNTSYTYGDDYTRSESRRQQTYFPSADYTSRQYADTSRNTATLRYHNADVYFTLPNGLCMTHNMRFADDRKDTYRSYANIMNGGTPVGGQTRNIDKRSRYDISDHVVFTKQYYSFSAKFDMSNDDGRGFRIDSLTSTSTHKELRSTSNGLSRKLIANAMYSIPLSKEIANNLGFIYSYVWDKSSQKQTSLDLADAGNPAIDTTNTYNFTNNYNTHTGGVLLSLYFTGIKASLDVKSLFSSTGINRDEQFPDSERYNKRFNAFVPSVSFMCGSMITKLNLSYTAFAQPPTVEQLRPRLDDSNPYMIVAGNQRLKQSYVHSFLGSYNTMFGKANNNIAVQFNLNKTDNVIALKRIFFTQETPLPELHYTALAQSTLTTYENVNGQWQAKAHISWIRPLRKLKSQLAVNAIFNYDDTPSFMDEALNRTKSYAPELSLNVKTTVSRSFRFTVGSRTSYIYSQNNVGQDDKYFQQGASFNGELINIFKRVYINAIYSLSYYKRFGGNPYELNNQILNLAVGCKVFKRNGDISFTAYDILNRNSGYKTVMYSDYIQNTWTRSFGRYFTFNLAYKFKSSKSGVTNSGVKDGSVNE